MRAVVIALVLLASPALAVERIAIVGDSIGWGYQQLPAPLDASSYLSRYRIDRSLAQLLAVFPIGNAHRGATVDDWGAPGSTPTDWTPGPPNAIACLVKEFAPALNSACAAGDGIVSHIPTGYDYVVVVDNGALSAGTYGSAATYVTQLIAMGAALDAVNGTVYLTSPPHGPASSSDPAVPADPDRASKSAIHDEMVSRGVLNGPDWNAVDYPMCADAEHFRDQAYNAMADAIARALP